MGDLMNRETRVSGTHDGSKVQLNFAGSGFGLLAVGVQINYTIQEFRVRELGTPRVFIVRGDGSGQFGFSRVVGPSRSMDALINRYSDPSNAPNNAMSLTVSAGVEAALADSERDIDLSGVRFLSYGVSTSTQQMSVQGQIQGKFENIEKSDGSLAGALGTAAGIAASAGL